MKSNNESNQALGDDQNQVFVPIPLEEYTPLLYGWLYLFHTAAIIFILYIGYKIHRALLKTFNRIGSRHINTIIIPTLVSYFK